MIDVIGENLGVLFGLLVVMWILQFGLTFLQMRKYTARLKIIRQDGLTSVGMSGSKYKGRTYGILTVDKNNKIIHAEKMSGWTNFSNLRPVPDLVGMNVEHILDEENELPISKKLHLAFRNAANDLLEAKEGKAIDNNAIPPLEEDSINSGENNSRGEKEVIN
jgi:DNA-binding transcriptional regulator of glucitol operon